MRSVEDDEGQYFESKVSPVFAMDADPVASASPSLSHCPSRVHPSTRQRFEVVFTHRLHQPAGESSPAIHAGPNFRKRDCPCMKLASYVSLPCDARSSIVQFLQVVQAMSVGLAIGTWEDQVMGTVVLPPFLESGNHVLRQPKRSLLVIFRCETRRVCPPPAAIQSPAPETSVLREICD